MSMMLRFVIENFDLRRPQVDLADLWTNVRNVFKLFQEKLVSSSIKQHKNKPFHLLAAFSSYHPSSQYAAASSSRK